MKHWIQKLFFLTPLLCMSLHLTAAPVDVETAKRKAAALLTGHSSRTTRTEDLQLRAATSTTYLFSSPTSFALMAADDRLPEVLGYGRQGDGDLPASLQGYLHAAKSAVRSTPIKTKPVAPLLPFVRHQLAPYNNHCPLYKTSQGVITEYHCVVGCVATALEEIISYYRRVVTLKDTLHGWETPKYTIDDVLPGTTVDCNLIRNNYDIDDYTEAEADAVSRLSYYCGVAAKMNWGINESGANIHNLVDPLQRAFGYQYVHFVDSYKYAPADWLTLMRNEMYAHRPVLYAAFNMWWAGHAFVIDGLDENGFFHVNWGYGGSYDGYFNLDVLNYNEPPLQMTPEAQEAGFFSNHQALLLHPDPVEESLPDTLARTGWEIAIDSVKAELTPETGKHTPLSVYVRNTTDQYLTTPFEFFTNTSQDTAILKQGDFIALGAARLAPYESRKLTVHANFNKEGQRILRISPDDVAMVYEGEITVEKGKTPQLYFREPQISFPAPDRALVTLTVNNASEAGRCGQEILYEMGPGAADVMKYGIRHSRQLYVLPGETKVDTITFTHLQPGETYTLLVRSPWKVTTQKTFTLPEVAGIPTTESTEKQEEIQWFQLDGRKIVRPQQPGIYLRKTGERIEKVYRKRSE